MKPGKLFFVSLLAVGFFSLGVMAAKGQIEIGNLGHPNLMQAERMAEQSHDYIQSAQRAREWDVDGHAANAEYLVEQDIRELRLSMESAKGHH